MRVVLRNYYLKKYPHESGDKRLACSAKSLAKADHSKLYAKFGGGGWI
jgi:hypothetical protein